MDGKVCKGCGLFKSLDDYHRNRGNKDGRAGKCKLCILARHKTPLYRERQKGYDKIRNKTDSRRRSRKEASKRYQQRHRDRHLAKVAVYDAMRRGKITRPMACDECLVECVPEAHHEDYSKRLDVSWLCFRCHAARHGWNSSIVERHGRKRSDTDGAAETESKSTRL